MPNILLKLKESNYANRFFLKIITHVPFLYPIYFILEQCVANLFSSIPLIFLSLELAFTCFTIILPISHIMFLSLTTKNSLSKLKGIQLEIKRNVSLIDSPSEEIERKHPDLQVSEIEINFFKLVMKSLKFALLLGLLIFSLREFATFEFHWIFKELLFVCFAFIYASNFGFKIYEKMDLKNEKWLFRGIIFMSYGIIKKYSFLFLEIIPSYFINL